MAGSIDANMSNSGLSGNAGYMLGSMSACMRWARESSVLILSFSAVAFVRFLTYLTMLDSMWSIDEARTPISSVFFT